jgi:hypothetical protein
MSLRHEPDVSKAAWFATRDESWVQLCCLGPSGFERYARLFPPIPDGIDVTDPQDLASLEGDLPDAQLQRLVNALARHTSTPDDCLFALWDGNGEIYGGAAVAVLSRRRSRWRRTARTVPPAFPREVMVAPRVSIPNRSYLLFAGPLAEAGQWGAADLVPGRLRRISSPNLMWPADHAWFVASEIDQPWTGIGGSAALIDDLLSNEGLDVEPTELSEHPPYWRP